MTLRHSGGPCPLPPADPPGPEAPVPGAGDSADRRRPRTTRSPTRPAPGARAPARYSGHRNAAPSPATTIRQSRARCPGRPGAPTGTRRWPRRWTPPRRQTSNSDGWLSIAWKRLFTSRRHAISKSFEIHAGHPGRQDVSGVPSNTAKAPTPYWRQEFCSVDFVLGVLEKVRLVGAAEAAQAIEGPGKRSLSSQPVGACRVPPLSPCPRWIARRTVSVMGATGALRAILKSRSVPPPGTPTLRSAGLSSTCPPR